jgi:tetratricopeptide (TPR) repeat protein
MKRYIASADLNVTDDPIFMEKEHAMTEELSVVLQKLHVEVIKGKSGTGDRLIKLIEKNPKNPQLKNLLTNYYQITDQPEKAHASNLKTIEAHPTYFFAKLNLANFYIQQDQLEAVREVLGDEFDLKELYPNRDTFHTSEALSMYKFAVIYHTLRKNFVIAQEYIDLMIEIDEEDFEVENAKDFLMNHIMTLGKESAIREANTRITVKVPASKTSFKTEKPVFNHPEIELLYLESVRISFDTIDQILNLPRATLIEDLVAVLQDGIDRYTILEEQEWEEETTSFVYHAINLLTEINATAQLSVILDILRQNDDFLQFYLQEFLTETIWITIYKLGKDQLDALESFMKEPAIDTYSKTAVSEAVTRIVVENPERRSEVIAFYQSIFTFYKNASREDNVIDSDLIGLMVADVLEFDGIELLPIFTELFNLNYVSLGITGDLDEIKRIFKKSHRKIKRRPILSMKESYYDFLTNWSYYNGTFDSPFPEHLKSVPQQTYEVQKTIFAEPKPGRNDRCTCGSGKKYKKCCM